LRGALIFTVLVLSFGCQPGNVVDPLSPNRPPTARFGAPGIAPEGSTISFNARTSSDPDQDALTFAWDFGDGVTLTTLSRGVDHLYRNNRSYVVTLIVSDSHGAADTTSTPMTIANVEPQITLLRIPDTVVAGTPFTIEIQYHDPGADDTVQAMLFVWHGNAGGGGSLPGPGSVTGTYYDPGPYTVSVVAWDNDGGVGYRAGEHPMVVVPRPSPQIAAGR
jgi:PKD repeat protein